MSLILTAISNNPNPKLRIKVVVNLHPSALKMDNREIKRFGDLNQKLKCIAQDILAPNPYHHYETSKY